MIITLLRMFFFKMWFIVCVCVCVTYTIIDIEIMLLLNLAFSEQDKRVSGLMETYME